MRIHVYAWALLAVVAWCLIFLRLHTGFVENDTKVFRSFRSAPKQSNNTTSGRVFTCGWQTKALYDASDTCKPTYAGEYTGDSRPRDILMHDWGPCPHAVGDFKGHIFWFDGENHQRFTRQLRPNDVYFGGKNVSIRTVSWSFLATAILSLGYVDRLLHSTRPATPGKSFLLFIQSNCKPHRNRAFENMLRIDVATAAGSCGGYHGNHERITLPNKDWSKLHAYYSEYKFALVMENSVAPGYITEKLMNAFEAGCVPIYYGHRATAEQYFNPEAFIFYDPEHPDTALQEIRRLHADDDAYMKKRNIPMVVTTRIATLKRDLSATLCNKPQRRCSWSPKNDLECMRLIRPLMNVSSDRRSLFLGDSTVWRMWLNVPRRGSSFIRTGRCDWLQSFGINRNAVWKPPPPDAGPVLYGLEHHWCTDCSGCNSQFFTGAGATNSYIAVEFAKDVEMQSVFGNTTQETLIHFLKTQPKHDVCVVNSGIHDQAIVNLTTTQYVANVRAYLNALRTVCDLLVWVETTAPDTDDRPQKMSKTSVWNHAVNTMILRDFPDIYIVGVEAASVHWHHTDNVHLDSIWYRTLAKLFI